MEWKECLNPLNFWKRHLSLRKVLVTNIRWKWMVGRCSILLNSPFLGGHFLVFWGVIYPGSPVDQTNWLFFGDDGMIHVKLSLILEPQTTSLKWMFGKTSISHVKIWSHPIETAIKKWLFRVPGYSLLPTGNDSLFVKASRIRFGDRNTPKLQLLMNSWFVFVGIRESLQDTQHKNYKIQVDEIFLRYLRFMVQHVQRLFLPTFVRTWDLRWLKVSFQDHYRLQGWQYLDGASFGWSHGRSTCYPWKKHPWVRCFVFVVRYYTTGEEKSLIRGEGEVRTHKKTSTGCMWVIHLWLT